MARTSHLADACAARRSKFFVDFEGYMDDVKNEMLAAKRPAVQAPAAARRSISPRSYESAYHRRGATAARQTKSRPRSASPLVPPASAPVDHRAAARAWVAARAAQPALVCSHPSPTAAHSRLSVRWIWCARGTFQRASMPTRRQAPAQGFASPKMLESAYG